MTRDPVLWLMLAGLALCAFLIAITPLAIAEFGDGVDDVLPCPKAFKDPRCTSEMAHVR